MSPEEVIAAARKAALTLPAPPAPVDAALERLRAECITFFERVPEPPLYRRAGDPVRTEAAQQLEEARTLLARALRYEQEPAIFLDARALADALEANVELLCSTAEGRLEAAEGAWQRAIELERAVSAARRIWKRTDESLPPVYDRTTELSRYDPRPEADVHVKLACPSTGCQTIAEYAFSPRHASHRFTCGKCQRPFIAYFAEVQEAKVEKVGSTARRYEFRVEELQGQLARVEFDDASGAEFNVARRDLLAFLYTDGRELRAVLDLSSSRLLWVQRGGPCFVVTVAFGEEASELRAFRTFRDEVLRRTSLGSALVRGYYAAGPSLAAVVSKSAWGLWLTRTALRGVHQVLQRRGFK